MDRTRRARGTQAQKRMLTYIEQNKPGQALWSPNRPYYQIMGPIWQAHHRDEQWDMYWNRTGRKTDLSQRDISWWVPQMASLEEEENRATPKATNNSIFHAQAEEIRSQGENEQRVFQYTELTDWRSVASKVLGNIGWTAECAYENTIFPQKVGTNAVAWEKIKWEQEKPQSPNEDPTAVVVYIIDGTIDGLTMNITMVQHQDRKLMGAAHVLGSAISPMPWAQPGLALAAGLRYLEHVQMITSQNVGPINGEGALVLYTDYPPLHSANQMKRWKIYGAPEQPSPEHQIIDDILSKWTANPLLRSILIKKKNTVSTQWKKTQQHIIKRLEEIKKEGRAS